MSNSHKRTSIHFIGTPSTDAQKGAWDLRPVFNYRKDAEPELLKKARDTVLKIDQELCRHYWLAMRDTCRARGHSRAESIYQVSCFLAGLVELIEDHPNMPQLHLDDPEDWDGFGGDDDD